MNLFIGIGNITRDAELLYTQSGTAVTKFTVAINEKYKDKEEVIFLDCCQFSDKITQYLRKGKKISVEGKLKQNNWEKDGKHFSKIELNVNKIEFLSPKDESEQKPQNPFKENPYEENPFLNDNFS